MNQSFDEAHLDRDAQAGVEYARGVHTDAIATNDSLYKRAQIVLSVDGFIVAALGAAIATNPSSLQQTLAEFGLTTWMWAAAGTLALVASVGASAAALFSRHREGRTGQATFGPEDMWFYGRIALLEEHEPGRFAEVAFEADHTFERRARLAQVAIMAPIMVRRARWLNRAVIAAALVLTFSALTATDYVVRVTGALRPGSQARLAGQVIRVVLPLRGWTAVQAVIGQSCRVDDLRAVSLDDTTGASRVAIVPQPGCRSLELKLTRARGATR